MSSSKPKNRGGARNNDPEVEEFKKVLRELHGPKRPKEGWFICDCCRHEAYESFKICKLCFRKVKSSGEKE